MNQLHGHSISYHASPNALLVSILSIILLVGHCNSTPLKPTLHSRKPSPRHATAFALQRRARFFRTQYRVVKHTLGATIVASPLVRVVPGIAELYGTGGHGARMYRQVIGDFTQRWPQLGASHNIISAPARCKLRCFLYPLRTSNRYR